MARTRRSAITCWPKSKSTGTPPDPAMCVRDRDRSAFRHSRPTRPWSISIDHGFRRVARHLANSGMLDVVATAIPGVRDVLVLGQIVQLERAGTFDLIVVDGPAAGHATTFLSSAHGLLDSSRAGPIHAQAADVVGLLSDPARCQVVLVTLAEETPVNETVETASNLLERVGTHLGPVIVNGLYSRLDHLDADPEAAAVAAGVTLHSGQADAMRPPPRSAVAIRRYRPSRCSASPRLYPSHSCSYPTCLRTRSAFPR